MGKRVETLTTRGNLVTGPWAVRHTSYDCELRDLTPSGLSDFQSSHASSVGSFLLSTHT